MTETVSNLMDANLLGVFNERDAQRRADDEGPASAAKR
jgi:hypothetical protein